MAEIKIEKKKGIPLWALLLGLLLLLLIVWAALTLGDRDNDTPQDVAALKAALVLELPAVPTALARTTFDAVPHARCA
ncbi:MAG TPA: hypothetical protein VGG03_23005 [Thermoanaerobaculia bacterium]|jgi:hypothetical protein